MPPARASARRRGRRTNPLVAATGGGIGTRRDAAFGATRGGRGELGRVQTPGRHVIVPTARRSSSLEAVGLGKEPSRVS